jgi:addiction module RelE/StbE family toxin
MKIDYSKKFIKEFEKCPNHIKKSFKERLLILSDNEFNPILNNHSLLGKLKDYRSININADWRAIFEKDKKGNFYFSAIGSHSQLYR